MNKKKGAVPDPEQIPLEDLDGRLLVPAKTLTKRPRNEEEPETASTQVASLRPTCRRATGEASTMQRAVKSGKKPHPPAQSVGFLN